MKTKILSPLRRDGYKAGMIMMLIALSTMLLTTACSSEDDLVNNTANTENTINKGYALPVTVNVTRQGDATTRATYTYDEGTKKGTLSFSEGDKLFVSGYYEGSDDYEFAGELTWQSGETFSGTIYTSKEWTGTANALFTAASEGYVNATLLPAGYGSYGFLTIDDDYDTEEKYDDFIFPNKTYTLATSKAAGVEQFSYEGATSYSSVTGFALSPNNAILNFTITGLAASTNVAVSLTSYAYTITKTVTTDSSGTATFAAGVEGGEDLNDFSLTVAGNAITLPDKEVEAGKIYNITRPVTPPTLAQTMTTAGMTVKVKYNYDDAVNYCLFSSNGDDTYTFQSGSGFAGADAGLAKALVVEDGKMVFKQNFFDEIDFQWSTWGFSVTFDTSNNSYIQFVGPSVQEQYNPSFISVEVNSVPIALTQTIIQKITVADLNKFDGETWSSIIDNNSDKIKEEYNCVVRISDNAKLQRYNGDDWVDVMNYDNYHSDDTYKFEGD